MRYLCENGHYLQTDCVGPSPITCEVCGSAWTWTEAVDMTNGWGEEIETLLELEKLPKNPWLSVYIKLMDDYII